MHFASIFILADIEIAYALDRSLLHSRIGMWIASNAFYWAHFLFLYLILRSALRKNVSPETSRFNIILVLVSSWFWVFWGFAEPNMWEGDYRIIQRIPTLLGYPFLLVLYSSRERWLQRSILPVSLSTVGLVTMAVLSNLINLYAIEPILKSAALWSSAIMMAGGGFLLCRWVLRNGSRPLDYQMNGIIFLSYMFGWFYSVGLSARVMAGIFLVGTVFRLLVGVCHAIYLYRHPENGCSMTSKCTLTSS